MSNTITNSVLTQLAHGYVQANYWANETIVDWVASKPSHLVEKEIASSFPGIRETLAHIWDTDRYWLSVIRKQPAPVSFREVPFKGTLQEVFSGLLATSRDFRDTVLAMDEKALTEVLHLDTPWFKSSQPRFQYIHHCMNHSSYHRGQVVTIGHHVGFHDAPMTDYNFYLVMAAERVAA